MAGYFVDTSALAKLYHQEPGSDYVERILNEPGSKAVISRLSLVELESVLAIKVRTGVLNPAGRTIALRRFRAVADVRRLIHRILDWYCKLTDRLYRRPRRRTSFLIASPRNREMLKYTTYRAMW